MNDNVVVKSDKDGALVLISKRAYLCESRANMQLYFNRLKVYEWLTPTSDVDLWITKGHLWQYAMALWLLDLYQDHLRHFLCTFMDSFGQPLIPKFRLLVETHRNMMITTYGAFASTPLLGMFRWAITPCSVPIGVAGFILLKIDRALHPLCAPLVDSYDLLARLRSLQDFTLDSRWHCSTIDFSAMHTRIT